METKNKKKAKSKKQGITHEHVMCDLCGRTVKPDGCIWQVDDDGALLCHDCRAERDSCGCSD